MKKILFLLLCTTLQTVFPVSKLKQKDPLRKKLQEFEPNEDFRNLLKQIKTHYDTSPKNKQTEIQNEITSKIESNIEKMQGDEKSSIIALHELCKLYKEMDTKNSRNKYNIKYIFLKTVKNLSSKHGLTCFSLILVTAKVNNILTSEVFARMLEAIATTYKTGVFMQTFKSFLGVLIWWV
jgi:hypothetical protein